MPSDATPSPSPPLSEHELAILEHVPDAIWVVGPDGRINFANNAATVLFGRPRAELIGAQAGAFLPGASSSRRTDLDPAPVGEPTAWQGHIQRPDGALLPAEFRAAPLHTGNAASGADLPSLVIARDVSGWITEHQRVREESERLQLLVANAPDIIFTCDVEHRFVWTNLVAETLTGYSARRLRTMTWHDLAPGESGDALSRFAEAAAGQTPAPFEISLAARGGLRATMEIRVWPLTSDGEPAGYQGIGRNVTDRKEAEEAAQRAWRESEALSDIAQELTRSLDRETVLKRIVEHARRLSHSDVSAIAVRDGSGLTFLAEDGVQPQGLGIAFPAEGALVKAALDTQRAVMARAYLEDPRLPAELRRPAQDEGVASVAIAPVVLDNAVAALIFVGSRRERDYAPADLELLTRLARLSAAALRNASLFTEADSANHQLEQALGRANSLTAAAEEAAEVKSEFLATMSHEIRTPLSGVIGMLDLLRSTAMNDEQDEYVAAHTSAHDLLALINDVLDFSKIEAGALTLERTEFDLRQIVESTVTLLAARAHERGLALVSFVEPALDGTLCGDPARIRQVLLNLIGNAVKFTDQGHIDVHASVLEEGDTGPLVRIAVQDTGVGVPPAARDRLFDPFRQADGSTTRTHGGTGLGLAISRRLVELMGGEIDLQSVEGEGSTFWFTIRLIRANTGDTGATEGAPADSAHAGIANSGQEDGALEGRHVLVVDDLPPARAAISAYVITAGAKVAQAEDAESALALIQDRQARQQPPFDIALIDRALPGMDGGALAEHIRADARLRQTRLILLTAFNQAGQRERAHRSGFDDVIAKPVRGHALIETIANVLAAAHPNAANRPPTATAASVNERRDPDPVAPPASLAGTLRVLVVEDNLVNQMVAVKHLEHLGIEAELVANGAEAVDALSKADYDLVFMDCQMPVMDGYAATRAIREQEIRSQRHTPIVAMTANAVPGDAEKCRQAGMDDYLSKPITRADLQRILDSWTRPRGLDGEQASPPPATGEAPITGDLLNPAVLEELSTLASGNDSFVGQLLAQYAQEVPQLIAQCRQAVLAQDPNTLRRAAHTLKGGSANIGAAAMAQRAHLVETLGANGTTERADDQLTEIEGLYQRTLAALTAWLEAA